MIVGLYQKLISILIISAIIVSCRKSVTKTISIAENIKNWFWADTGSYWIYEVNGMDEDSLFVKDVLHNYFKSRRKKTEFKYENLEIQLNNEFIYNLSYLNIIQIRNGTIDGVDATMYKESVKPGSSYSPNGLLTRNILDSVFSKYTINNLQLDSTLVWKVKPDYVMQSDSSTYYFSKGVGITRMIDHTRNKDWKLKRYKITRLKDIE